MYFVAALQFGPSQLPPPQPIRAIQQLTRGLEHKFGTHKIDLTPHKTGSICLPGSTAPSPLPKIIMRASRNPPKRFPFRLHDMLNDAESHGVDHIISWLPCGKMFKVHNHKEFANKIMPRYCRHNRYKSFLRQLSMYKFLRVNEGSLRGAYHHPNFQRNRLDLIELINRKERDGLSSSMMGGSTSPSGSPSFSSQYPRQDSSLFEGEFELVDFGDEDVTTTSANGSDLSSSFNSYEPPQKLNFGKWGEQALPKSEFVFDTQRLANSLPSNLRFAPLVNTPEDILDEIISTFGQDHGKPQPLTLAGRCA
eukprot:Nitzschia sp. Nitz4//scaffold111_size72815//2582//3578//NITZ4_005774-RA/size72815-snap-gene-0.95-mRNA-1//1//CDS//3329533132//5440//frame0